MSGFQAVADAAGWDGATQIEQLLQFIEENCCTEEFEEAMVRASDGAAVKCAACGVVVDKQGSIDCTECIDEFCDNCYDTGKGDGCHCHPKRNS